MQRKPAGLTHADLALVLISDMLARGWSVQWSGRLKQRIVCANNGKVRTSRVCVIVRQTDGIAGPSKASCRRSAYRGAAQRLR